MRDGTAPHYPPSGHLLFAVRFDADALQTIGGPVPLVTDVKTQTGAADQYPRRVQPSSG